MSVDDERMVEVCDRCLCASCWQGDAMCEEARDAGTIRMSVAALKALKFEHPDWYSVERIREVEGV